jgi:pimeloyl-[acyl-carrier protein] methyl ester esterase
MKKGSILLISGWAHGEGALRPVAEAMAGFGRPVVCFSLASPSFGDDEGEGVSGYARTVSTHLEKADEPGCIIGWSTGGVVAIETAARYPDKVAGLVLLSATPIFCSDEGYTPGVKPAVLRAMIRGLRKKPESVVSDFIARAMHPLDVPGDVLAGRTQAALAAGTDSLVRGLEYLAAADLRRQLSSIALPCLIMHGRQDMIVPWEAGGHLASHLPQSEIELIASGGHSLVEQCGDGLVCRIAQFVERL